MEFLPGDHTLEQTISSANLAQLTLHGDSSYFPEVTSRIVVSLCEQQSQHSYIFAGNTELHISTLAFISGVCGGGEIAIVESEQQSDITYSIFQNIQLYVRKSILTVLTGNTFQNIETHAHAVYAVDSSLELTSNIFQNNSAWEGGALFAQGSALTLIGNTFQNNYAYGNGGALYLKDSTLNITGNTFHNNAANRNLRLGDGGLGGALYIGNGNFNLTENTFYNNSAEGGGALKVKNSTLTLTGNTFHSNSATGSGGTLSLEASNVSFTDNTFTDSTASSGGAIAVADSSNVTLYGNNIIANNTAQYGGGITIADSQFKLVRSVLMVQNNTASYGGGLYVHNTSISGSATFNTNVATEGGGGIYASRSTLYFMGNTTFTENSAIDGGGLLLSDDSKFYLQQNMHIHFTRNSAKRNGGAIKVEESNPITYCTDTYNSDCFFQLPMHLQYWKLADLNVKIYFENNSAVAAGADLHGGSVDNCELINYIVTDHDDYPISGDVFNDITNNKKPLDISSYPLHICTCSDNQTDCTGYYHPKPVYPGGTLEVPVIARGQRNGPTIAKIQVIDTTDSNVIIFQETETIQIINKNCTALKYTIQSTAENSTQEMTLYAEGPCPPKAHAKINTMLNTLRVRIDSLDCPPGFQLSQTQPAIYSCTDRLQQFTNTCRVDDKMVLRKHDARFWVGYDNHSRGVILHPHCPFDYCILDKTYLAVDDSDKQCSYNRSGLLCGRCSENLSLALGNSGCLQCSNSYIALLFAFAFSGITLVFLLLILRLTVAAGTINGLIFYANVVAVNSATFFQPPSTLFIGNILTVFIAWLNLDLGIETCFYNGMDAYAKTWLQFAFPLYVWVLVGMIILGSHCSERIAKMFGSNPIAVMATLFLLSYAKLLRTVIAALSYTFLEFPNNSQVAVWLYDGNIRYLSGKHIPLFLTAMVCLIFLFLPYTMLLIFSQWLQTYSIFFWINGRNFRPLLDAYHAPYTNKHRYWTGLMLLIRFVLFLISAVNALGDPSVNLLATITTTIALPTILGTRIYKTWCLSLLETSFILNLAILSAASLYIRVTGGNQNAVTFTSVGIAFARFTGIVVYHFIQQLKGTRLWRRVNLRHDCTRIPLTDADSWPEEDPPDATFRSGSAPTQTVVDICYNELREPCMTTD